ncbi:MAG: ATP-binding protein [Ktedonobacteraceae bacterium]
MVYPANFLLIASMRPCPCGFSADPITACTCSARSIARYQKHMHAWLLEHIDLHIEVPRVDEEKLEDKRNVETSAWKSRRLHGCKQRRKVISGMNTASLALRIDQKNIDSETCLQLTSALVETMQK